MRSKLPVWQCHFSDNGGKVQNFRVKAADKTTAINKAHEHARKYAKGDLSPHWEVRLVSRLGF